MLSSVIEVLPGEIVVTAEKRLPNSSGDDVEEARLARRGNLAAWVGHAASVAEDRIRENRKITRNQVRFLLGFFGEPGLPQIPYA